MSNNKRLFGTDGIRGVANSFPMTPEIVLRLGKALGFILNEKNKANSHRPKVIVGKDTRLSGYLFEQAISSGISSMGADVLLVGPLPTPAIAFLTANMRADAGIVISASHNPYQDNGIKIFDGKGFKLPDEKEMEIEDIILNEDEDILIGSYKNIGKSKRIDDAAGRYIVFVKKTFPNSLSLDGLKIVIDCANGSGYRVGPIVLEELGSEVVSIGINPDGKNINTNCGSLNPDLLKEKVLESKADLGIALDGDADRVIFCDEKGQEVDGDKILAICTEEMLDRKLLRKPEIVATQMSNMGLEFFLNNKGIRLHRTPVGDRYVIETMREKDINLGGEKSGHIIFLDHTTTGDGLLASLQVLAIMKRLEKPLSELAKSIDLFPQILKNVQINEKVPLDSINGLNDLVSGYSDDLGNKGRINIRYSGTEPIARVMVEGEDKHFINQIASDITNLIEEKLG